METLSRTQNLTMTDPTMTLEFCPLLLLSEGNGLSFVTIPWKAHLLLF